MTCCLLQLKCACPQEEWLNSLSDLTSIVHTHYLCLASSLFSSSRSWMRYPKDSLISAITCYIEDVIVKVHRIRERREAVLQLSFLELVVVMIQSPLFGDG